MARTTDRPSTATRPNTATAPLDTSGSGSFDEQDRRGEGGQLGDNAERRENLAAVRDEQDNTRDNSRDASRENRDERGNHNRRGDRGFSENRDERTQQHDGDTEQGSRREQQRAVPMPAMSAGLDAFAPVLEAWKQIFKAWSELAETMVKAQQDTFASMIGAANTTAKEVNVGDRRNGELAFSGQRTTVTTPDRSSTTGDNR